jgi:hypothetical protein
MKSLNAKHLQNKYVFRILAVINSTWIFYIYLSCTSIGLFRPAALSRVLEGTAERPYIYRVLIPVLAKSFASFIPLSVEGWFANAPLVLKDVFERLKGGMYPREATIVLVAMFLSLVGFVLAEKIFLADLGFNDKEQLVLSLVIQSFILPFNMFTGYYYDLPQLFLITLSLLFMYRRNWGIYFIVFELASLNKETSLFLIMVFAIYYWQRLTRTDFFKLLTTQIIVYGFVRMLILYPFQNNPGSPILWTLPAQYNKYVESPYALIFTLLYFSTVILLVLRKWNWKHEFLRAASVTGLIILVLFFFSGTVMEFRIFLDAWPALGILVFAPVKPADRSLTYEIEDTLRRI